MSVDLDSLASQAVSEHGAQQKPWELARLGELIVHRELRTAIEVGSLAGGTTWFLHQLGLAVTAVDLDHSRAPRLTCVRYVEGASASVADKVKPADIVFVDGDHTYRGVRRDWDAYRSKVLPGGLAAFHDVVADFSELHDVTCHVDRLWRQLEAGHRTVKIVDPSPEPWGGIGVVFL